MMKNYFHILFLYLSKVNAFVAAGLLGMLVVLINLDIIWRTLFSGSLPGVTEIVALAIPVLVFLALPYQVSGGLLIRNSYFLRKEDGNLTLEIFSNLVSIAISVGIVIATVPLLFTAIESGEFFGTPDVFTVSVWPLRLAILLGSLLAAILFAYKLVEDWRWSLLSSQTTGTLFLLITSIVILLNIASSNTSIGLVSIALLLWLVITGVPVAFSLLCAGFVGLGIMKDNLGIGIDVLGMVSASAISSYVFAAVPLFVLMGLIVAHAKIGRDSLRVAYWCVGYLKGGLGIATVGANTIFAAITGISIASASIFSKVAAPELIARGFTPKFALGLVAGSSVLGMLIPPSILLIIYGIIAEVSINKLFIAAIIPGLLLALLLCLVVVLCVTLNLNFAVTDEYHLTEELPIIPFSEILRIGSPIFLLVVCIVGGIYGGVFTPTEAGAVGSTLSFIIALSLGRIKLKKLIELIFSAMSTTSSLLFMIIGASAFGLMLTLSGIPETLGQVAQVTGLGLTTYVCLYFLIVVFLGTILDSTSILLVMVPIGLPVIHAMGGDLIWFGIVTVIGVEVGLLTPPLGLSIYAIKASIDDESISLGDIFYGASPFAILTFLVCLLLIFNPNLCLFLL
jgi:tripartite ATP-independent transporter DctM subunit